jgi:gliding motility-associated-like protein
MLLSVSAFSQNALINNGASIKIFGSGTPSLHQDLEVFGNFENQNDGTNDGIIDLDNYANMSVSGDWTNNSFANIFDPNSTLITDGTITLDNSNTNQVVGGLTPTFFENLIVKGERKILVNDNNSVNSSLLIDGILELNNRTFEIKNKNTSGIIYKSGFIKSEGLPGNYGSIKWNTDNTVGMFSIPFGSDNYYADNDLQFSINLQSAMSDGDYFIFSTYHTDGFNQPLPSGATNLETEVRKVVDRFWVIEPSDKNNIPTTDITFSYASSDVSNTVNAIDPQKLVASRNNTDISKWLDMEPRGIQNLNTIEIENVQPSEFYSNWTLLNMPPVLADVFVPDAFSPNGDGVNDLFLPIFQVDFTITNYEFLIYNRWGNVIFSTKDQTIGWNGVVNNKNNKPLVGVYSWVIIVKGYSDNNFSGDGIKQKFTGMVTLIM